MIASRSAPAADFGAKVQRLDTLFDRASRQDLRGEHTEEASLKASRGEVRLHALQERYSVCELDEFGMRRRETNDAEQDEQSDDFEVRSSTGSGVHL